MINKQILTLLLAGKLRFRELATILGFRSCIHGRKYFVSDKLKIVYIPVSKSGNSSIKKMLLRAEGIAETELSKKDTPYFIHSNKNLKSYTRKKWDKKWNDYFVFTVVRDPVTRFLSSHHNKFKDIEKIEQRGFEFKRYLGGMLHQEMSSLDVLAQLMSIPDKLLNEHFVPQYFWITKHHKCSPQIYHLEDLNTLVADLNDYGLDIKKLEKANSSKSNHSKQISSVILDLIEQKYRQDYQHFNYSIDEHRGK